MMKVIAVGGSNTLINGGYVGILAKKIAEAEIGCSVLNLGIGDTNSSMALYRLLEHGDAQEGDVILWEYALNDRFGLSHRGDDWYLRNLEYVLIHAIEKKCHVVPIIMVTRADDKAVVPIPYRLKIHHLCNAYGVNVIDVPNEVRAHFGVSSLNKDDYRDDHHYTLGGRVVHMIADIVVNAITTCDASLPRKVKPLYAREGYRAVIRKDFVAEPKRQFNSSILDISYHDMRDGPVTFRPEIPGGRALSLIVLTSPGSGKCEIEFSGKKIPALMSPRIAKDNKILLRAIMGEYHRADLPTDEGDVFRISVTTPSTSDQGNPRGIVAVVTEEAVSQAM